MTRADLYGTAAAIDARHQIRLLELLPGAYDDLDVTCRLSASDIPRAAFEALSYTWGARSADRHITLNDLTDFEVTDNLFAALRRLRRPDRSRTLWIDALCIDQENLDERSQQVQLMGDVYRQAQNVVVWLGNATEPKRTEQSPFRPSSPDTSSVPTDVEDWKMRSLSVALAATQPQWWKRTWIIQEAVLASHMSVLFGQFEMSWTELGTLRERMSAMMEISRSRIPSDKLQEIMTTPQTPGTFGFYMQQYRSVDSDDGFQALETLRLYKDTWSGLSEIASVTGTSQATDPKDRVYGYLGLWSAQGDGLMSIDYRRPVAQVFADATYADIQAEKNLRVLNLVRPADRSVERLPSWALDFSFGGYQYDLAVYPTAVVASSGRRRNVLADDSTNWQQLGLKGHIIDAVKEVHVLPNSLIFPAEGEEHLLETVLQSVPHRDAYHILASRVAGVSSLTGVLDDRSSLPPSTHFLAQKLGVQTDPISNVFLWWLSRFSIAPNPRVFSELHEWWRGYASYQSWTGGSERRRTKEVFFVTECGFIGRGLPTMQIGDVVASLHGLEIPAVICHIGGDAYTFKGLAWVNGGMEGESHDVLEVSNEALITLA